MVKLYLLVATVALSACASKSKEGANQEPNENKAQKVHWMHGRAHDA